MSARASWAVWIFVALNVLPTGIFLALARALEWTPEVAKGLQLPLIFTPVLGAVVLTRWVEGEEGIVRLWRKTFDRRAKLRYWLFALLSFALVASLALGVRYAYDGSTPQAPRASATQALFLIPFLFFFPGLTEEPGWRGFLQPELVRRFGLTGGSIGVGLTWGLWHGRSLATDPERYAGSAYLWFLGYTVAVALMLGWLWSRTNGNVLLAITGHFGANLVNFFGPMSSGAPDEGLNWKIFFALLFACGLGLCLWESRRIHRIARNDRDPAALIE